jgi:hypothetical protein
LDEDWIKEICSQSRGGWGHRLTSIINTDCPTFALSVLVRPRPPKNAPWTAKKTASFKRHLSSYEFYVISGGHRLEVLRRALKADLQSGGNAEPSEESILDHPNAVWVCDLFSHGKLQRSQSIHVTATLTRLFRARRQSRSSYASSHGGVQRVPCDSSAHL